MEGAKGLCLTAPPPYSIFSRKCCLFVCLFVLRDDGGDDGGPGKEGKEGPLSLRLLLCCVALFRLPFMGPSTSTSPYSEILSHFYSFISASFLFQIGLMRVGANSVAQFFFFFLHQVLSFIAL